MKAGARGIALLGLLAAAATMAAGADPPRHLLVQVRDTPPQGPAATRHGADGSYAVSTGAGGDRDDRAGPAPGNGTTLSTSNSVRRIHVVEGERVRVDLPAVQSLQFHVPALPAGGKAAGSPAAGGSAAAANGGGSAPAPSVTGVINFEAVSAFAARFALAGSTVLIELSPLRAGTVSAPYAAGATGTPRSLTLTGRVGQWIALGDTAVQEPAMQLNATADAPQAASVWVRVDPEPADVPR